MTKRRKKKKQAIEQNREPSMDPSTGHMLPPGAVLADRSQQVPWGSYDSPPTYYVDIEFVCRDCGAEETWTAEQQKWYYEVAKGQLYATAVRCRPCRQWKRTNRGTAATRWYPQGIMRRAQAGLDSDLQQSGYAQVQTFNSTREYEHGGSRITFGLEALDGYGPPSCLIARHVDNTMNPTVIATLKLTQEPTRLTDEQFEDWTKAVLRFARSEAHRSK